MNTDGRQTRPVSSHSLPTLQAAFLLFFSSSSFAWRRGDGHSRGDNDIRHYKTTAAHTHNKQQTTDNRQPSTINSSMRRAYT